MKSVKIGIVGMGRLGKRHALNLRYKVQGADLVAFAELAFSRFHPQTPASGDVAALAENLVLLRGGKVQRTIDLKGAPYRDALGNPVRGEIRRMLMKASGISATGSDADVLHTEA